MRKVVMTIAMTLLAGIISGWAQSSTNTQSNSGREGSSSVNNASKANNSQTLGKGVPYTKDAEQQGRSGARKTGQASGNSATGSGSSASGKEGTSSGKGGNKSGNRSSAKTVNQ